MSTKITTTLVCGNCLEYMIPKFGKLDHGLCFRTKEHTDADTPFCPCFVGALTSALNDLSAVLKRNGEHYSVTIQ
jgi:hypothetical protein